MTKSEIYGTFPITDFLSTNLVLTDSLVYFHMKKKVKWIITIDV